MRSARYKALPIEYLHVCFSFNKETGDLVWNTRPSRHFSSFKVWRLWNANYAGKLAGTEKPDGRRVISIDGVRYYKSVLCWALFYGSWPEDEVDHKDVDPSNDAILNLREAARGEQNRNTRIQKNNKTGYKNICEIWRRKRRYFFVQLMKDRKRYWKIFKSLDEAVAWAEETRRSLHQDFARSK